MPGGTTAIIIASSASAAAEAARSAAERAECRQILSGADPRGATVEAMRAFAHCVYVIHGDGVPLTESQTVWIKILIISVIISAFIGAYLMYQNDHDPVESVLGFFLGPCALLTVVLVGAGLFYGLAFVVGA